MSPKARRAQQEVPPAAASSPAAVTASLEPASTESEQSAIGRTDKEHKEEADQDMDINNKKNEGSVSEEAEEKLEVSPKGSIPCGDSERPVEECPDTTEPIPKGEPSVASRLMTEDSREGESDNLSMEGVVLSEEEPESRCDKVAMQVSCELHTRTVWQGNI